MSTPRIEHYTTDVHAHWEGIHPQDWAEVDLIGYENAMDKMYRTLCENPDAALVQVGHRSKLLNDHGSDYRFNGKFTSEQTKPERSHHDYNHFGKLMKWEGDRPEQSLQEAVPPFSFDRIFINASISSTPGTQLHGYTTAQETSCTTWMSTIGVSTEGWPMPLILMEGLGLVSPDATETSQGPAESHAGCFGMV
ncbi:hypothetical protein KXW97_004915 [Aspergillus fumigatus]|nr:hypothetical protein KXW97_004915 [Aspergillus fumigatus]